MATRIYLTNDLSDIDPGGANETALLASLGVPGSGLVVGTTDTVASGTNVQVTNSQVADIELVWFTAPLAAWTYTNTNTIIRNLWMAESNMSANVTARIRLDRCDNAGTPLTNFVLSNHGTELPVTNRAAQNWSGVGSGNQVFAAGERLKITVLGGAVGTMASGFAFTFGYAGPTDSADGDSWVEFVETITEYVDPGPADLKPRYRRYGHNLRR